MCALSLSVKRARGTLRCTTGAKSWKEEGFLTTMLWSGVGEPVLSGSANAAPKFTKEGYRAWAGTSSLQSSQKCQERTAEGDPTTVKCRAWLCSSFRKTWSMETPSGGRRCGSLVKSTCRSSGVWFPASTLDDLQLPVTSATEDLMTSSDFYEHHTHMTHALSFSLSKSN